MSNIAIRCESLGKQYRIGKRERYQALRDKLTEAMYAPFRHARAAFSRNGHQPAKSDDTIWALKDVSFEIKHGEVVGVIGRNGAGKSTLLKILSRITEPTTGQIAIHGRVGSLLEVGTGFHPELTGQENIFLNGAILGMPQAEIKRKFDEIVAFAEIEKFLDTPVKHYSSGMYVRLAFAVAAHLEPEILLVDEVLAVGDAAFQKKCLGKMGDVAREGRTVLFVSHNMAAITVLCQRALLLQVGSVIFDGLPYQAVEKYLCTDSSNALMPQKALDKAQRTKGNGLVKIDQISLRAKSGELAASFHIWEPIIIEMAVRAADVPQTISLWVLIYSSDGKVVLSSFQYDVMELVQLQCTEQLVRVTLDPIGLVPGRYSVSAGVFGRQNEFYDWIDGAILFEIGNEFSSGRPFDNRLGDFSIRYHWEVL